VVVVVVKRALRKGTNQFVKHRHQTARQAERGGVWHP
jgi:hypothetical protein